MTAFLQKTLDLTIKLDRPFSVAGAWELEIHGSLKFIPMKNSRNGKLHKINQSRTKSPSIEPDPGVFYSFYFSPVLEELTILTKFNFVVKWRHGIWIWQAWLVLGNGERPVLNRPRRSNQRSSSQTPDLETMAMRTGSFPPTAGVLPTAPWGLRLRSSTPEERELAVQQAAYSTLSLLTELSSFSRVFFYSRSPQRGAGCRAPWELGYHTPLIKAFTALWSPLCSFFRAALREGAEISGFKTPCPSTTLLHSEQSKDIKKQTPNCVTLISRHSGYGDSLKNECSGDKKRGIPHKEMTRGSDFKTLAPQFLLGHAFLENFKCQWNTYFDWLYWGEKNPHQVEFKLPICFKRD